MVESKIVVLRPDNYNAILGTNSDWGPIGSHNPYYQVVLKDLTSEGWRVVSVTAQNVCAFPGTRVDTQNSTGYGGFLIVLEREKGNRPVSALDVLTPPAPK